MKRLKNSLETVRQVGVVARLCLLVGLCLSFESFADELNDASSGVNKALGDFYNALKTPGADPEKLKSEILTPARNNYSEAQKKSFGEQAEKLRQVAQQKIKKGKPPKMKSEGGSGGNATKGMSEKPAPGKSSITPQSSQPSQPDVILDGKGIPGEIEFSGPKRQEKIQQPKKR